MEVMEAIEKRYSARGFADRNIEPEKIRLIMEAGRLAPTGSNEQPNKHIVVTDKSLIHEMVAACRNQEWIHSAPAILVECAAGDRTMVCGHSARVMDGAIAMSYMTLEAVSLGLQFVWLGWFEPDKVRPILNIPEDYIVVAVAPIGYPAKDGAPVPKKSADEVIVYNRMQEAF